VLGVTSFTFYIEDVNQVGLLAQLGQQLVDATLWLEEESQELTKQHAMTLSTALPSLQKLELRDIGSVGGGAEFLLAQLTELKMLTVVSIASHMEAWKEAVRTVNPPGLVFDTALTRQ
jgi:hypothetical protein